MGDIQNLYNDYSQLYNHDYHDYRHVFLHLFIGKLNQHVKFSAK